MPSSVKFLGHIALAAALSSALVACQPKAEPVKPDAQQQASLERLRKNCIAASRGKKGVMMNLGELRKKQQTFTCDEMKQLCEADYASEMCRGTMLVASVENAHQKACRFKEKGYLTAACKKLSPCNAKGFTSPECASVIAKYNK